MSNVIFKSKNFSTYAFKVSALIMALSIAVFFLSLKQTTPKPYRKILSTLNYSDNEGKSYQVLKIQNEAGINVEIFELLPNSLPRLNSAFKNIGNKDGYFVLGGTGTNLAMFDIDHDLKMEILIPSFDKNLTAKLDIIKFDEPSKKFIIFEENGYSSF